MRLYNPKNGAEFDTESDDELHNQVYLEMGWVEAPEPEQKPGYEPEPVTYAPVTGPSLAGVTDYGELDNHTVDELRAELERRGLPKSGTKDELIDRLLGE